MSDQPNNNYYQEEPSQGGANLNDPQQSYEYYNQQSNFSQSPNHNQWQNNNPRPRANGLCIAAFVISIASFFLCCCNFYILLAGGILSITLAICSRFIGEGPQKLHGLAVAAIVIGAVAVVIAIMFIMLAIVIESQGDQAIYNWFLSFFPDDPETKELLRQQFEQQGLNPDLFDYFNILHFIR